MKAKSKTNWRVFVFPIACIVVFTLFIVALNMYAEGSPEIPVLHEDTILNVSFMDEFDAHMNGTAIIETDRLVIVEDLDDIDIVTDNTLDAPLLIERDIQNRFWPSEFSRYILRMPTPDLKDTSQKYTDTYGETLPVTEIP